MGAKQILVFGAAGFVGTYLIHELTKQGYEVTATDISKYGETYYKTKKIPYVGADITDKKDFLKFRDRKFDAVIHLAALQPANVSAASYDPSKYIEVNVIGTLNVLEFCRRNKVKK